MDAVISEQYLSIHLVIHQTTIESLLSRRDTLTMCLGWHTQGLGLLQLSWLGALFW